MQRTWYKIQNKADKKAEIMIYEQIGKSMWDDTGISARAFVADLRKLDVEEITLSINSPGGSVFEGNSIYNALRAHKAKVNVKIDGIAASIASVIAMAGDTIEMPENAMMMIHDPWGFAMGTSDDMLKQAEALDKIKIGLVAAYAGKTGMENDEIDKLMTAETWMTAREAVAMGFADKVLAPVAAQAHFNMLAQFQNVPAHLTAGISGKDGEKMGENNKTQKPPEITLDLIKNDYPAIAEALIEQGRQEGKTVECDRIKAIYEQSYPGFEGIVNAAMFDGISQPGEVAIKVLASQREKLLKSGSDLKNEAPDPISEPLNNVELKESGLDSEEKAQKAWNKNANGCKDEFMCFEDFWAYVKEDPNFNIKTKRG